MDPVPSAENEPINPYVPSPIPSPDFDWLSYIKTILENILSYKEILYQLYPKVIKPFVLMLKDTLPQYEIFFDWAKLLQMAINMSLFDLDMLWNVTWLTEVFLDKYIYRVSCLHIPDLIQEFKAWIEGRQDIIIQRALSFPESLRPNLGDFFESLLIMLSTEISIGSHPFGYIVGIHPDMPVFLVQLEHYLDILDELIPDDNQYDGMLELIHAALRLLGRLGVGL